MFSYRIRFPNRKPEYRRSLFAALQVLNRRRPEFGVPVVEVCLKPGPEEAWCLLSSEDLNRHAAVARISNWEIL